MSLIKQTQVSSDALAKLEASQRELSFLERQYQAGGLKLAATVVYSLLGIGLIHGAVSAIACAVQAKSTESLVKEFAAKQVQVLDQQAVVSTPGAFKASKTPEEIRKLNGEADKAGAALAGRVQMLTDGVSAEEARDVIKAASFLVEQQMKSTSGTKAALAVSQDFRGTLATNIVRQAYEELGGEEMTEQDYQKTVKSLVDMKLFATRDQAAATFKKFASEQLSEMTDREFNKHIASLSKPSVLRRKAREAKNGEFDKVKELGEQRADLNKQIGERQKAIVKLQKEIRELGQEATEFDQAFREAETEIQRLVRVRADKEEIDPVKAERDEAKQKARECRDNISAKRDEITELQREAAKLVHDRNKAQAKFESARGIFRNVDQYAGEKGHKFPSKPNADMTRVERMIRDRAAADQRRLRDLRAYKAPEAQTAQSRLLDQLTTLRLAAVVANRLAGDGSRISATDMQKLEKAKVFGELYAQCGNGSSEAHWARNHFNQDAETVEALQAIIAARVDAIMLQRV